MKRIKKELISAITMVITSAVVLITSTYAWYVTNNSVEATTTTISATTNGFILQIATVEEGAQHGGGDKSLAASAEGHKISPSSTNNFKKWFVSKGWGIDGKVTSYSEVSVDLTGKYVSGGEEHYAYVVSEYILYTITKTGFADVYLDSSEGSPITVSVKGNPTSQTVPNSLRIGIATVDDDNNETLRVVYAPTEVTGKGNDSEALDGKWTYINVDKPAEVTYPHIFDTTYTDQNDGNWCATKVDKTYIAPSPNGQKIAGSVGYDGVIMRVYMWMEGTDSDCVNNSAAEDEATYSVTVRLAGVAAE